MNNMRKISEYVSIDLPDITENTNAVGMLAISKGMKEAGHQDIKYDSVHSIYSRFDKEKLHNCSEAKNKLHDTITEFKSDECLMCLAEYPEVHIMEETIIDPFADKDDDDEEEYNE